MSDYTDALEYQLRKLSNEIAGLPWWRIIKRYRLVDAHQNCLRLLASMKGFIK